MIDIRHREIKDKWNDPINAIMNTYKYEASDWIEYFLTMEDKFDRTIFSLLRFRIPSYDLWKSNQDTNKIIELMPELKWSSLIREIHTFWDQLNVLEKWNKFGQHIWFWKRLIQEVERISKEEYNLDKIAVIAWVWVRWYYEKRWYHLEWEYMVKYL